MRRSHLLQLATAYQQVAALTSWGAVEVDICTRVGKVAIMPRSIVEPRLGEVTLGVRGGNELEVEK